MCEPSWNEQRDLFHVHKTEQTCFSTITQLCKIQILIMGYIIETPLYGIDNISSPRR